MNTNDLVFCEKDNQIYSCGYAVKSLLLTNQIKPIHNVTCKDFNSYTIPAGLTYFMNVDTFTPKFKTCDISNKTLHDKLLDLVERGNRIKYKHTKTQKNKLKLNRSVKRKKQK